MTDYENLAEKLCEELEKIDRKTTPLTNNDLEISYKLTTTLKNLYRIREASATEESDSYSRGNSYGRHLVRSHYSRNGERYSRADGRDKLLEDMRGMMDDDRYTEDEKERIRRAMSAI